MNTALAVAVQARRVKVSEMYLAGRTQSEIASSLGVTQQQISKDLQKIQLAWRTRMGANFGEKAAQEIAKLDARERECLEAFFRSVGRHTTVTHRRTRDGEETTEKSERLAGDPRFQLLAIECCKKHCDILGLNAPTSTNVNVTGDELIAAIAQGAKLVMESGNKIGNRRQRKEIRASKLVSREGIEPSTY
jgi:transcriptional regulator with XRE-family HTH domain